MKTIRLIAVAMEFCTVSSGHVNPLFKREKFVLNEHVKRKQNE